MWLLVTLGNVTAIRGCRRSILQLYLREGELLPVEGNTARTEHPLKATSRVAFDVAK
jgi:hypothetical protein